MARDSKAKLLLKSLSDHANELALNFSVLSKDQVRIRKLKN